MNSRLYYHLLFVVPALLWCLLLSASETAVAGQLAATLHRDNQNVRLQVSVPTPPPSSIIAALKLPNNTKIVSTSPGSAKIDPGAASVKWLVKNPRPGTLQFSASTSPPADFSKVSAEILYRAPGGGTLVKVNAAKR